MLCALSMQGLGISAFYAARADSTRRPSPRLRLGGLHGVDVLQTPAVWGLGDGDSVLWRDEERHSVLTQ